MTVKDHYQVLGIPRNCSEDDIKKAYRSLAKQYHPDKNDDAGAEEKFKEISGAYEVLKDSDKKRVYDLQKEGEELRAKRAKEQSTSKPANNASSRTSAFNNGTFFFKSPGAFSFTQNGTKFKFSFFDDNDEDIADDSRKKDKDNNKDKNKTKKKKKDPPSFPRPWEHHATSSNDTRPEWNNDFATESDEEDEVRGVPRMSHGFPFRKFGDPFKQMDDMFKDFFKDPFFDMGVSTRRNQRGLQEKSETKPKKEKKPMEDMYDWSKPMFNKKRSHFDDEDYDYSYESDEDISKYLFPCSFCGRKFHSVDVHKHEETCKKIHHGHSKNPEASESPGPAKKNSKSKGNSDDKDDDSERYHSPSPPPRSHNWRQEHEELKSHVRNARKAAKSQKEAKAQKPVKTNCPWCGREFDTDVAERHIPFCKERTQSHGEPATPRGNPTARDYGSKSYTAREYARNIPKPKTSNDTPFRPSPSRTGRDFMDEPYTYTGSGLHPHTRPTRTKATGGSTSHLGGVSGKGYTTPRASASTSFISSSCPSSYNRSYVPTNTRYITTGYYPHASSSVSGNNAIRSSYSSYIPAASLSSSIRVPSYSPSTSSLSLGQGTYIPKYRSGKRL